MSWEHVKATSKGGKDTYANRMIAHRICNTVRGNLSRKKLWKDARWLKLYKYLISGEAFDPKFVMMNERNFNKHFWSRENLLDMFIEQNKAIIKAIKYS